MGQLIRFSKCQSQNDTIMTMLGPFLAILTEGQKDEDRHHKVHHQQILPLWE